MRFSGKAPTVLPSTSPDPISVVRKIHRKSPDRVEAAPGFFMESDEQIAFRKRRERELETAWREFNRTRRGRRFHRRNPLPAELVPQSVVSAKSIGSSKLAAWLATKQRQRQ
jgi:hypothetical protein